MTARWGDIHAQDIATASGGECTAGDSSVRLHGISTDTRTLSPGSLFWALKGERFDGHDFIEQAIDQGAAGVVIEKGSRAKNRAGKRVAVIEVADTLNGLGDFAKWWRRQHPVPLAAVTGSMGKTTTKEMTAKILERTGRTLKNPGNFNNLIGLPLTLLSMERGHQRAVLEMGMNRPGEIGRLTDIADPDIGLITNVGRAHLEGVGTIEGVARAKFEMMENMSSRSRRIINGDDPLLLERASEYGDTLFTYGLGIKNDMRAEGIQNLGIQGISFDLVQAQQRIEVRIGIPGRHHVYNALAAAAIAYCMEGSFECIAEGLASFKGVKGRFQVRNISGGITLVDDSYNSNPSSLEAALESLNALARNGGRIILGLGEMLELGEETDSAHFAAGEMAAESGAEYLIAIGDHADSVINGARRKGCPPDRALRAYDQKEMVDRLKRILKPGDILLVKGSRMVGLEKVIQSLTG